MDSLGTRFGGTTHLPLVDTLRRTMVDTTMVRRSMQRFKCFPYLVWWEARGGSSISLISYGRRRRHIRGRSLTERGGASDIHRKPAAHNESLFKPSPVGGDKLVGNVVFFLRYVVNSVEKLGAPLKLHPRF